MTTLTDMQNALIAARKKKNERQMTLRRAANELVLTYRSSLPAVEPDIVYTGEMINGLYSQKPVTAIELSSGNTLHFILTTVVESHIVRKFVVSVSIAMREQDDALSVQIEGESLPLLVLGEGTEGRFYEVAEKIKACVLAKIELQA